LVIPAASDKGFAEAQAIVGEFSEELLQEAGRIARRYAAEQASPEHVKAAAKQLYTAHVSKWAQLLTNLGSIIIGVAASAFVSFLVDDAENDVGLAVSLAAFGVGVAMTAVGLAIIFRR
jgi:hypothetical protein